MKREEHEPWSSLYWRQRQEEVRTKAEQVRDDYAKAMMLQLAVTYGRLAQRAAEREAQGPSPLSPD